MNGNGYITDWIWKRREKCMHGLDGCMLNADLMIKEPEIIELNVVIFYLVNGYMHVCTAIDWWIRLLSMRV